MNEFIAGTTVIGVFGLAAFASERKFRWAPKLPALTNKTEQGLKIISYYDDPNPDLMLTPDVPMKDVVLIYLQSRENRRRASEEHADLGTPKSKEVLSRVQSDHGKIRRLALACMSDRVAAKLVPDCKALYPRVLLWTLADENAALKGLPSAAVSSISHKV